MGCFVVYNTAPTIKHYSCYSK